MVIAVAAAVRVPPGGCRRAEPRDRSVRLLRQQHRVGRVFRTVLRLCLNHGVIELVELVALDVGERHCDAAVLGHLCAGARVKAANISRRPGRQRVWGAGKAARVGRHALPRLVHPNPRHHALPRLTHPNPRHHALPRITHPNPRHHALPRLTHPNPRHHMPCAEASIGASPASSSGSASPTSSSMGASFASS
eukprot:357744-Chlamydomonas_euryale.AAC.2